MAGSIQKRIRNGETRYMVTVDIPGGPSGKRARRTKTVSTAREAKALLADWLREARLGTLGLRSLDTVSDVLDAWLTGRAALLVKPATLEGYRASITNHITPTLGALKVQDLRTTHIDRLYAGLLSSGVGVRTVQLAHLRLCQALDYAVDRGLIALNPARKASCPKSERLEMKTWSGAEAKTFLRVAKDSGYGPIWATLLHTGLRRGEALGLRWADLDEAAGHLRVRQSVGLLGGVPTIGTLKTGSANRDVPITPDLVALLKRHRTRQKERRVAIGSVYADHGLIFASDVGTPINPNNLIRDFVALVGRAGVPRIRIHDLRHTYVTLQLRAGSQLGAVSRVVGHAKTSITMDLYAHILPEAYRETASRIADVLNDDEGEEDQDGEGRIATHGPSRS